MRQPIVALSTAPTFVGDDGIEPRHVDLRPFAVNDGDEVWVLPGGLTRVVDKRKVRRDLAAARLRHRA
mgnify:CR=1 FL=1